MAVAAWVPFDPPLRPADSVGLAIRWINQQARLLGARALIVAPHRSLLTGDSAIGRIAKAVESVTPRSHSGVYGPRSVLVHSPGAKEMHLAMTYAEGGAIAALEWPSDKLIGWAIEVGALNLRTGAVTEDTRTDEQREWLEHLLFVGNNGWGDTYGKRDARSILGSMKQAGCLDRDLILGHMMAHRQGEGSIKTLAELISKA
jgi:hypothetical protein